MDFDKLTYFLDHYPSSIGIPGCSLKIWQDHRELYSHYTGYENAERGNLLTPGYFYNIYSATKPIVCTGALQLIETGRLHPDTSVADILPAFRHVQVRDRSFDGTEFVRAPRTVMTVAHLMSMTGGLNYDLDRPSVTRVREQTAGACPTRAVVDALAQDPLEFDPGTHFRYSLCHDVLGAVIEEVSGMRLGEYLRRNIFDPLGMEHTGFRADDYIRSHFATAYDWNEAEQRAIARNDSNVYRLGSEYESGGAGLISSLEEYILFADAMANRGVGRNGARILSGAAIDLMRTNRMCGNLADECHPWPQLNGYGYGLGVRVHIDRVGSGALTPLGEFGWDGAKGVYLSIVPEHHLAFVYFEHLGGRHTLMQPRLRNAVYACLDLHD